MSAEALIAELQKTTALAIESGKPLAERLRMIADRVRALSPDFADAVDRFVGRLTTAEAGASAPQVGERLPEFVLSDHKGKLVTLRGLLQEGPVIVAFLRGHWCPYCRITAAALSEIASHARTLDANVVAITPETRVFAQELADAASNEFPILADLDNGYALSANLAIWVDDAMASLIASAGWDIPSYQGNDSWMLPIPGVFVLDREGVIRMRHVNPDYRERADLDGVIAALEALR